MSWKIPEGLHFDETDVAALLKDQEYMIHNALGWRASFHSRLSTFMELVLDQLGSADHVGTSHGATAFGL